jgi:hypothetical protein
LALTSAMALLALKGADSGSIGTDRFAYALLPIVAVKLTVCYRVQLMQTRSYQLYRYFGGVSRSGAAGILLGFFLRKSLFQLPLVWALIFS